MTNSHAFGTSRHRIQDARQLNITSRLALLLTLFACGCVHTPPHRHIVDSAVLPKEFSYFIGGTSGGGCSITIEKDTVVLKRLPLVEYGQKPKLAKPLYFQPYEYQWEAFWRHVAILDVFRWRSEYAPSDIGAAVFDGSRWRLKISYRDRSVSSEGENAYPAATSVNKTSLDNDRLQLFEAAVEQLIGHPLE